MPDAVLEVYLEHLLIMKKDGVACEQSNVPHVHNAASREPRALIPISSTSWEGAVQAIIPECPSPEIAHKTARNPLADDARSCFVLLQ